MNEDNPNIGQQFDRIIGANFTPEEERGIKARALGDQIMKIGHDVFGLPQSEEEIHNERYATRISRMHNFPKSMIRQDEDGLPEVFHSCNTCGLDHTWNGGSYVNHGKVDANSIHDYSLKDSEQSYAMGDFHPQHFFDKIDDFHEAYGYDK
jgi:hypothetical protein